MKIGIYSDAHFSACSSILMGQDKNSVYSKRLATLINSFEWLYGVFAEKQADLIINCGDMTSSDTITSEENSALSKSLSYSKRIPEIHLLGNHDIKDVGKNFSSIDLLGGYPHISVIRDYCIVKDFDIPFVLIPYTSDRDVLDRIQVELSFIEEPCIVFSHLGYLGEGLMNGNGFIDTTGLDKDIILSNSNVRKIFNGHLHNPLNVGNYCQVGALIGNGFGDSYSYSAPRILIYDTQTDRLEAIKNPHAVLFYKFKVDSFTALKEKLENLKNPCCVQVTVPLSIREKVSEYMASHQEAYNIVEFRVKSESVANAGSELIESDSQILEKIEKISDNKSVLDLLKLFTETADSLPSSLPVMLHFLEKYF